MEESKIFQLGKSLLNGKHYKKASEFFSEELSHNPENYAALNNRGLAYCKLGIETHNQQLLEDAINDFERAIELADNNFPTANENLTWAKKELNVISLP